MDTIDMVDVYNGMTCHYEILGFAIDFCQKHNIKFTIYNNFSGQHAETWKNWYINIFGPNLEWRNHNEFNAVSSKKILLLTDDDYSFLQWKDAVAHKTICIQHYHKFRVLGYSHYVGTRWYPDLPDLPWALPVYPIKEKNDKCFYDGGIHVACVGNFEMKNVGDFLKSKFADFDNITFHLVNRRLCVNVENFRNIYLHENIAPQSMMDIVSSSHFAFRICEDDTYICYQERNMSGIIPIALSCGTRMIMPEKWKETHKLSSVLTYTEGIPIKLSFNDTNVEEVLAERDALIQNRDKILSEFLV